MFVSYLLILCIYITLGNAIPELFFEDFQDQAFEESQLFLAIKKVSYLEHIAPMIIFSIYSIELELHDRKVYLRTYIRV
jgi:hypothetical protein